MVRFDFVVSDAEAEDIMSAIHDQVIKCHLDRVESWGTSGHEDPARREWFTARINYLEELKKKMTNRRIYEG